MIDRTAMVRQLRLHEGERLKPYRCTAGKLTIGIAPGTGGPGAFLCRAQPGWRAVMLGPGPPGRSSTLTPSMRVTSNHWL